MSQRIDFDPRVPGNDQPVEAVVDRLLALGLRVDPEIVRKTLMAGVERVAGLVDWLESEFTGTTTDAAGTVRRVGKLVISTTGSTTDKLLAALMDLVEDGNTLLETLRSELGIGRLELGYLKTGLYDRLNTLISNPLNATREAVEDLDEFLDPAATFLRNIKDDTMRLLVLTYAYDSMVYGLRGLTVNAPQDHINGPQRLVSATNVAAATYDYDTFVTPYALISVEALWANQAGKTGQLDFLARLDDNAVGTWTNVNGSFTANGTALGGAIQNGQGIYFSTRPMRIREFRVEYIKVGAANVADTVELWTMIGAAV